MLRKAQMNVYQWMLTTLCGVCLSLCGHLMAVYLRKFREREILNDFRERCERDRKDAEELRQRLSSDSRSS